MKMNRSHLVTASLVALLLANPLSAKPAKKKGAASRCSYAHYPIAVGDINEYRLTSKHFGDGEKLLNTMTNTYSDEVTAVKGDHFQTKSISQEYTSETKWACRAEGIEMKLGQFPDTKITTTGVTIPAQMKVGGVWKQTFEMETADSSHKSKTVNRIIKREKVVVPAGTFDAYRIEYEMETTAPEQARGLIRGTQWFAPGAGIVKSVSMIEPKQDEIRRIESMIELIKRTSK